MIEDFDISSLATNRIEPLNHPKSGGNNQDLSSLILIIDR